MMTPAPSRSIVAKFDEVDAIVKDRKSELSAARA